MLDFESAYLHTLSDPVYYDTPDRIADEATRYCLLTVPAGWRTAQSGLWSRVSPDRAPLPAQGWKVHISATAAAAETTLAAAAGVFFSRGTTFKYLRSADALRLSTGKFMPRGGSGKFITAYPVDERQFEIVLGELVAALDGRPGPYILSDLRIGRGPVYVRYGSFTEQWTTDETGEPVLALRAPGGELVADHRQPVFRIPGWAPVPSVLAPHLAGRRAALSGGFPYIVKEALNFSNSGGVYLAEHRDTGERVVLREARPHSGLDVIGTDAITRLNREYQTLRRLEGLPCVPRVHGITKAWEHHFLVEEYIAGQRLSDAIRERNPIVFREPGPEPIRAYVEWATGIMGRLFRAIDDVHARGVNFGDLHPGNVIIRPDGSVVLIDFEYSTALDDGAVTRVGAPGFTAPAGTGAADVDRYGLRAVWLFMLTPMVELAHLDPAKVSTLEAWARGRFQLPADAGPPPVRAPATSLAPSGRSGENAVRTLFEPGKLDWPTLRDLVAAGIHQAATPERADRLFPADGEVFRSGGHTLAYGAAGILLALHRAGTAVPAGYADWLIASARRAGTVHWRGLFDGLYGTAVTLHELGRESAALEVLEQACAAEPPRRMGLHGGLAGTGLVKAYFARVTGDGSLLSDATAIADELDSALRDGGRQELPLPKAGGLMRGLAGAAMLHLQIYRLTGEDCRLESARRALRREMELCVRLPDGTYHVLLDGYRHVPYLDGGSSGIALAAREYLTHQDDRQMADFVDSVQYLCNSDFVREPSLFLGRSGLLATLALLSAPAQRETVLRQASKLGVHAVHRNGTLLFPGERMLRFSSDLSTGAAGVLLALHTAFNPGAGLFPFLPYTPYPSASAPAST